MFVLYRISVRRQGFALLISCAPLSLALSPSGRGNLTQRALRPRARSHTLFLVSIETEAVKGAVLFPHVSDPWLGRQRPPRRPLQQLLRCELASLSVDVLLEPTEQISKLAPLDLVIEVRHL